MNPRNSASSVAIASLTPALMSTGIFLILSGVFSATSSMSTPPSGLAMMTGPLLSLSIRIQK